MTRTDPKHGDRRPPDPRSTDQDRATPFEVRPPAVFPRVEQSHDPARPVVDPGQVRPFETVTPPAREGTILERRGPAVAGRNDVIDLEWVRVDRPGHPAVL